MGKFVLRDAYVAINGTAISDHLSSVTVEDTAEEVEFTSFGAGYREFGQGLHDATITCTAFQDFAASNIDSIFNPLYASGGTFGVEVRPVNTTVSSTNPKYNMTARLYSFNPVGGAVGEASTTELVFRNAGTAGLVRGTT